MAQKGLGAAKEAVVEAQKNNTQAIEYPKFTLKVEEGKKRVRFLNPEDAITFIEHWTEYQNGWKRNYVCPNEGVLGRDECITCRGKKGVDYVTDQRKHAHMIQLINREAGRVEVWKFSPMAMAVILEQNDANGNISDRDFIVQFQENDPEKTGIKAKFIYTVEPATDKPEPLSKADKALTTFDLETLVPKYDEENLVRISQMTAEQSKKGGIQKPAATAADFVSQALGNKKNLADEFTSITKKQPVTAGLSPESTEEFLKMIGDMS